MKELVTEKILIAYFEKRATRHEKLLIRQWLGEGNEESFYLALAKWEAQHQQFSPDEKAALESFKNVLHGRDNQRNITTGRTSSQSPYGYRVRYASIAAAVVAVLCVAFFVGKDFLLYDTYATSFGMTQNILLEDGTEVTLNANSRIKVPKNIKEEDFRQVWLEGEAFFAVAKRQNHVRFAVNTDNLRVEVLGTKFNVNDRRGKTEVVLSEGSVKLVSKDGKGDRVVYMKPGDLVSTSSTDNAFHRRQVKPEKFTVWQSNKLVFEETPLDQVAAKIEDYYGVTIEIADTQLAKRELTGTLPNNDLGIVLRALGSAHNLKIKRENNRIYFE